MGRLLVVACLLAGLLVPHASAQDDGVIQSWDFEKDSEGWTALDSLGTVKRTDAEDVVTKGAWALEFIFQQRLPDKEKPDEVPGMVYTELAAAPVGLQSVRFSAAANYSTPLLVALVEEDESAYTAVVWCEAGDWTDVDIALAEFAALDDMPDENGKLDLDQVKHLAFADGGTLMRSMAAEGAPIFVEEPVEMTLWLDDVALSSKAPVRPEGADAMLDACDSETILWLPIGGERVSMTNVEDEETRDKYLKVEYSVPPQNIWGILRGVSPGRLTGAKGLRLEMRAEMPPSVICVFETTTGGRYMAGMQVAAGEKWTPVEVLFSAAQATDDSPTREPLDPAKIKMVAVADILPMMTEGMSANTWHLRRLEVIK